MRESRSRQGEFSDGDVGLTPVTDWVENAAELHFLKQGREALKRPWPG